MSPNKWGRDGSCSSLLPSLSPLTPSHCVPIHPQESPSPPQPHHHSKISLPGSVCSTIISPFFCFSSGENVNAVPPQHKLCHRVSHIWVNHRGSTFRVQWVSLALGNPPSWSRCRPCQVSVISPFSSQTLSRQNQRRHYPFASTQANNKGFLVMYNQGRFQGFLYQQTLRSIHSPQFTWPQGRSRKTAGAQLLHKRKRGKKKKKKDKEKEGTSQRQVAGQKQVEQSDLAVLLLSSEDPQPLNQAQVQSRACCNHPVWSTATWSIRGSWIENVMLRAHEE